MLQRPASCLLLVLALLALPASAHAVGAVRVSSVTTASSASAVRLACPRPWVAVSGAVVRTGSAISVRQSLPGREIGDWSFRLGRDGGGSRTATSTVRCVRLALPDGVSSVRLNVKSRFRRNLAVPAGDAIAAGVGCGRGWLATGHGFRVRRGDIQLASAVPTERGWAFVVENTGSRAATVDVGVRCLRSTVRASGSDARLRFRVTRPSRRSFLGGDSTPTLSQGCGRGRSSLATGSEVDPSDGIELVASGPTRPALGRWDFRRASSGDVVDTTLVCLDRRSRFR